MAGVYHIVRGSCSCGRNRYVVDIPSEPEAADNAEVFLDNSNASRRTHAAPLAAYLRVPLSWYRSTTFAFFPDETHSSIRRTYNSTAGDASPDDDNDDAPPPERRQFCGYCGTQLSSWRQGPRRSDEDFICVTLGSVLDEDAARLVRLGLLPEPSDDEVDITPAVERDEEVDGLGDARRGETAVVDSNRTTERAPVLGSSRNVRGRGMPWFESMVEDSALGRVTRRRGGDTYTSQNGTVSVEYEIVEVENDGNHEDGLEAVSDVGTTTRGKRKHEGDMDAEERLRAATATSASDVEMSGAL